MHSQFTFLLISFLYLLEPVKTVKLTFLTCENSIFLKLQLRIKEDYSKEEESLASADQQGQQFQVTESGDNKLSNDTKRCGQSDV